MGALAAELSTINIVSQLEFILRMHKQRGPALDCVAHYVSAIQHDIH